LKIREIFLLLSISAQAVDFSEFAGASVICKFMKTNTIFMLKYPPS